MTAADVCRIMLSPEMMKLVRKGYAVVKIDREGATFAPGAPNQEGHVGMLTLYGVDMNGSLSPENG